MATGDLALIRERLPVIVLEIDISSEPIMVVTEHHRVVQGKEAVTE